MRRKTINAYLKDDATFNELGVYTILFDVFDGELLFPLLGDPFKAEPEPEPPVSRGASGSAAGPFSPRPPSSQPL